MTILNAKFDVAKVIETITRKMNVFGLPSRLKIAPSLAKMTQDGSKIAPRPAKTTPRPPQDRLKTALGSPKIA